MANSLYLNIPMENSFYNGSIEKKKLRKEKARWYHDKNIDDQEYLDNILPQFFDMLKLSGERICTCQDAKFIARKQIDENGKTITYYGCSRCNGNFYKVFDYSFLALWLGMKRSGKTTSVLAFVEQLHKIDPCRKVSLWNCPDNLLFELHNINWCNFYDTVCERAIGLINWNKYTYPLKKNIPIGTEMIEEVDKRIKINGKYWTRKFPAYQYKNMIFRICPKNKTQTCGECEKCPHYKKGLDYFRKITKPDEIEQNDILIMDEAIINVNAKKALSKDVRFWDEILAIIGHKRIIMFAMFQRYAIIKSLREMADMIGYKRLPSRLIENEKEDKFMKRHQQKICNLNKDETVIVSELHFFNKIGIIYNRVPEWYTEKVSTSYTSEIDFVDDRNKMKNDMELGSEIADWMRDQGIIITDLKDWKDRFPYFKFQIREHFFEKMNNRDIIFKYVMESYFNHQRQNQNNDEESSNNEVQSNENQIPIDITDGTITETEFNVFREVCNGRSFTDFDRDPYFLSKSRISEIVRNVGNYLLLKCIKNENKNFGDDVERNVKRMAWNDGGIGFRMAGSGGQRGYVPSPDNLIITKNGFVRPIQVKMRTKKVVTLSPLTFNNELAVARRIKEIAKNNKMYCPHCLELIKGSQTTNGGFLFPDEAHLYATKRLNRYKVDGNMLIEPIVPDDNKKSIRINFENKKIIKQEPDLEKIKNQKIIDFINGDELIYTNPDDDSIINEAKEDNLKEEKEEEQELGVNKLDIPKLDEEKIEDDDFDGGEFDIDNYDDNEDLILDTDEENNSIQF